MLILNHSVLKWDLEKKTVLEAVYVLTAFVCFSFCPAHPQAQAYHLILRQSVVHNYFTSTAVMALPPGTHVQFASSLEGFTSIRAIFESDLVKLVHG